jgi:hypothetical protein
MVSEVVEQDFEASILSVNDSIGTMPGIVRSYVDASNSPTVSRRQHAESGFESMIRNGIMKHVYCSFLGVKAMHVPSLVPMWHLSRQIETSATLFWYQSRNQNVSTVP